LVAALKTSVGGIRATLPARPETRHQNGRRCEAGGKLNPWSLLPLEAVIPFRDFGQQALPARSRRHWAEPFRASRIGLARGRKRLPPTLPAALARLVIVNGGDRLADDRSLPNIAPDARGDSLIRQNDPPLSPKPPGEKNASTNSGTAYDVTKTGAPESQRNQKTYPHQPNRQNALRYSIGTASKVHRASPVPRPPVSLSYNCAHCRRNHNGRETLSALVPDGVPP
jgi:hypothetical protein